MSRNKSFMCNEQLYLAAEKCDYFVLFIFTARARVCGRTERRAWTVQSSQKKFEKKSFYQWPKLWNGFFVDISFRHYDSQSVNWWGMTPRLSKRAKKFDFQKKAKQFGSLVHRQRLLYYLGLNFRNQTNYFDHSYTLQ